VVSIRWPLFLSACTATILSWTDSVSAQQRWVEVVALLTVASLLAGIDHLAKGRDT
jgi:hypothetical protein